MTLAIFDLDNTLLNGDSDHAWGEFMCQTGIVDSDTYRQGNDHFHRQYDLGCLDINEFLEFALAPLAAHSMADLATWHHQFMDEVIKPMVLPKGLELIKKHQDAGDLLMIITATNHFVTRPIADYLGIDILIATDPEIIDGRYTGKVHGIPSFQDGKVKRLKEWMDTNNQTLEGSYFYSDSKNDLPLLEQVTYPFAVNPDEALAQHAKAHQWPILDLRS